MNLEILFLSHLYKSPWILLLIIWFCLEHISSIMLMVSTGTMRILSLSVFKMIFWIYEYAQNTLFETQKHVSVIFLLTWPRSVWTRQWGFRAFNSIIFSSFASNMKIPLQFFTTSRNIRSLTKSQQLSMLNFFFNSNIIHFMFKFRTLLHASKTFFWIMILMEHNIGLIEWSTGFIFHRHLSHMRDLLLW